MRINDFHEIIKRRAYVEEISCGEWEDGINECRKKEVEILSEDVMSTIEFLKKECTADEYIWISEIIDDLATKTQSRELIDVYKNLMSKFPEECSKFNISGSLEYAEAALLKGGDNG